MVVTRARLTLWICNGNRNPQRHRRPSEQFPSVLLTPGGSDAFAKKFGTRGVLHALATDKGDPTENPVRARRQAEGWRYRTIGLRAW
jgi:hypothetical protein